MLGARFDDDFVVFFVFFVEGAAVVGVVEIEGFERVQFGLLKAVPDGPLEVGHVRRGDCVGFADHRNDRCFALECAQDVQIEIVVETAEEA